MSLDFLFLFFFVAVCEYAPRARASSFIGKDVAAAVRRRSVFLWCFSLVFVLVLAFILLLLLPSPLAPLLSPPWPPPPPSCHLPASQYTHAKAPKPEDPPPTAFFPSTHPGHAYHPLVSVLLFTSSSSSRRRCRRCGGSCRPPGGDKVGWLRGVWRLGSIGG